MRSLCCLFPLLLFNRQPAEGYEEFWVMGCDPNRHQPLFFTGHTCMLLPNQQVLDIPRTLEYLETQGVCVTAYGADEFPAFFSRHSGCKAPCRVDTPEQ